MSMSMWRAGGVCHPGVITTKEQASNRELIFIGPLAFAPHSPDGRAPWAPSAVQAAIAQNSPKKAFPEETSKMADGQLGRAVPVSRGTSPGELPRALYALRTVPTRKGPSVQNPRRG